MNEIFAAGCLVFFGIVIMFGICLLASPAQQTQDAHTEQCSATLDPTSGRTRIMVSCPVCDSVFYVETASWIRSNPEGRCPDLPQHLSNVESDQ